MLDYVWFSSKKGCNLIIINNRVTLDGVTCRAVPSIFLCYLKTKQHCFIYGRIIASLTHTHTLRGAQSKYAYTSPSPQQCCASSGKFLTISISMSISIRCFCGSWTRPRQICPNHLAWVSDIVRTPPDAGCTKPINARLGPKAGENTFLYNCHEKKKRFPGTISFCLFLF